MPLELQVANAVILIVIPLRLKVVLMNLKNVAGIYFLHFLCKDATKEFASRFDSYICFRDLGAASLPSPAASLSDISQESSDTSLDHEVPSKDDSIILFAPPTPAASSGKRKRRLSDTGNDGRPKRPHNTLAVPRLQTVSDPFPNPIVNELYEAISHSLPDAVSVESLNDTQVEVDFYNYNTSPDAMQSFLFANSSLGLCDSKYFSFYQVATDTHTCLSCTFPPIVHIFGPAVT